MYLSFVMDDGGNTSAWSLGHTIYGNTNFLFQNL